MEKITEEQLRTGFYNHLGIDIRNHDGIEKVTTWFRQQYRIYGFVGIGPSGKYYAEVWGWKGGAMGWEKVFRGQHDSPNYDDVQDEMLGHLLLIFKTMKDEGVINNKNRIVTSD